MYTVVPTLNGYAVHSPKGSPIDTYNYNLSIPGSQQRALKLAAGHADKMNALWQRKAA